MIGLREIRKEKHLNQQKVAMDLHITREALSHYENGRREPTLAMLVKMSEYFNVSIDYLITGKDFQKVTWAAAQVTFCITSEWIPGVCSRGGEGVLAQSAHRAHPVIGDVLKGGAGGDAAVGISHRRVVLIAAHADVFHACTLPSYQDGSILSEGRRKIKGKPEIP